MVGRIIDNLWYATKSSLRLIDENQFYLDSDFGKIRVFDTRTSGPVIVNVPDGPNVIEHQLPLIKILSKNFRVVCFEYPGLGCSYPNRKFDYRINSGAELLFQVMDLLKLTRVTTLFSCSNGFYALKAASECPDKFIHMFCSQTPSVTAMNQWSQKSIPTILKIPVAGQIANIAMGKKIAGIWHKYALPKNHPERDSYTSVAQHSIQRGGCFCLSSLVQGLKRDINIELLSQEVPSSLVWGSKDFTHRHTKPDTIREHAPNCETIEFSDCGHFPELEQTSRFVQLVNERTDV